MRRHQRFGFGIATIALLLSMVGVTQAAFLTTGVYDENIANLNAVDVVATGSNQSLLQFTGNMSAAYAANSGGVVDFDTNDADLATSLVPGDPGRPSFTALYGTGHSKSLIVTRLEYVATPAGFGMNQNIVNERISGASALGFSGSGAYTLSFSTPLKKFGITALSRGDTRSGTMTITHTDLSTYSFGPQDVSGAGGAFDTLFAYAAPGGKSIASVNWGGVGSFLRWDDMAFAVPEPCSFILLSIPAVGLLFDRRK